MSRRTGVLACSPPGSYRMSAASITLFSAEALTALNRQRYDGKARGRYELMSGGLIWADEFL